MVKKEKLLDKAERAPQSLRFSEFEMLLSQCDWTFDRQAGSHRIWYSPKERYRLPIQEKSGKAKAYQVRQFLEQYEKETNDEA